MRLNYNFLPDGYADTLVLTETLDEVMADKLVSLVNTTGYVRHRDIWDLRWLKQQGAKVREVRDRVPDLTPKGKMEFPPIPASFIGCTAPHLTFASTR